MVKRTRQTQSSRAGLLFPVSRIFRNLKTQPQSVKRLTKTCAVYATAVLEYLTAEILELSGNACRDYRRSRITPRHILLAIANDEELHKLLKNVTIPSGGIVPHILPELITIKAAPLAGAAGTATSAVAIKTATKVAVPKRGPFAAKNAAAPKRGAVAAVGAFNKVASLTKKGSTKTGGVNLTVLSEKTLFSGQKLTVLQADICDVVVDAIVHPTNNTFYLGGEVGSAISAKGGKELRDEVTKLHRNNGNLTVGGVAVSDAGTKMLCSKILHVYSPSWNTSAQAQCVADLDKAVKNILTLADANNIKTLALPSVSSGNNNYPKQVAAETILRSINGYFRDLKTPSTIKQVTFVLYDAESVGVYVSELGKLDVSS